MVDMRKTGISMLFVLILATYCVQVNGNWGTWDDWSACSETCGTGSRTRTRTCNSTGGSSCAGDSNETLSCLIMNYCIPSYYGNTDLGCSAGYFGCASGVTTCINMTQRCDQSIDCEDGSDENPYFTNCTLTICHNGATGMHTTVFTSMTLATLSLLLYNTKN